MDLEKVARSHSWRSVNLECEYVTGANGVVRLVAQQWSGDVGVLRLRKNRTDCTDRFAFVQLRCRDVFRRPQRVTRIGPFVQTGPPILQICPSQIWRKKK